MNWKGAGVAQSVLKAVKNMLVWKWSKWLVQLCKHITVWQLIFYPSGKDSEALTIFLTQIKNTWMSNSTSEEEFMCGCKYKNVAVTQPI